MIKRVLVVDDEASVRSLLKTRLERKGWEVAEAGDGDEALRVAKDFGPYVAVTDLRMPGKDGFAVVKELKVPTIIITGHGDKESALRAVDCGAFAFFEKPFDLDQLEVALQRGVDRYLMEIERSELLKKLDRLCQLQDREIQSFEGRMDSPFVGSSPGVLKIKDMLRKLALKPVANVLILGETGTGKEVVARELHHLTHSGESRIPFLALNCAAIPTELLESELFGHEKGSFTGAHSQRIGLAEAVREGTLFLDEIGEMDVSLQAKLLRLIQERRFKRVGANNKATFNGRIVAATHRNLKESIARGAFREDLYYRLAVIAVELPPLRERGEDVRAIAEALCRKHGLKGFAPKTAASIGDYSWPGNIRELNNWIERAAILGQHSDEGLMQAPLPTPDPADAAYASNGSHGTNGGRAKAAREEAMSIPSGANGGADVIDIKTLRNRLLEDADRRWIHEALERHHGNISAAARDLGLDRKNLSKRMKALGIPLAKESKAA